MVNKHSINVSFMLSSLFMNFPLLAKKFQTMIVRINSASPFHNIKAASQPMSPTKFSQGNCCGGYLGRKLTFKGTQSLDYSFSFHNSATECNNEKLISRIKR